MPSCLASSEIEMRKTLAETHRALLVCLTLIVATLAVYWQVRNHDFLYYDDHVYVTENPHVQGGLSWNGISWALTTTHSANWHPLTWLSHMVDCQIFGLNAGGHHLSSLLLHLANTLLLFAVLRRMTSAVWPSAFVAALFALHPLHVESVAWVAERKDVLSTFFWMTTMWAYVRYVESPVIGRYLLVLLFFALGLAAKPMLVTLPFVLLLMDYWPLRRFQFASGGLAHKPLKARNFGRSASVPFRLVREKVPFLALAIVSGIVTLIAQQASGAIQSLDALPLQMRFANTLTAYVIYIGKMIWPSRLAVFYPLPGTWPLWQPAGAVTFLVCVFVLVIREARRRPYLAVGWLWYFVTLLPVIGLVQVGSQAMADRYTYVPLIGLFIIIAWGVPELTASWRHQRLVLSVSTGVVLSALMILTWSQVGRWRNATELFDHALNVTTNNYVAENNLGLALAKEGRFNEAIARYSKALQIHPQYPDALNNLGAALSEQGRSEEAIQRFSEAVRIAPNFLDAHYNLALSLVKEGRLEEAASHLSTALEIYPDDVEAHNSLGFIMYRQGKIDEAIRHFSEAVHIKPDFAMAHNNLGRVLAKEGRVGDAIHHYSEALRIKPNYANAHYNLGVVLAQQGRLSEAIRHFSEALQINPDYEQAQEGLNRALAQARGREQEGSDVRQ
jgi:tetratricopeptide (TPR) repeat protein